MIGFPALALAAAAAHAQGPSGCVPHSDMVAPRSRTRERLQQASQPATPSSPSSTSSPVNLPPSSSPLTIVTTFDGRRELMGWSSAGTSWADSQEQSAYATASTAFIANTASQAVAAVNHRSSSRGARARWPARASDELGDELVTSRRWCRASQIVSHVASRKRWLGENEPGATSWPGRARVISPPPRARTSPRRRASLLTSRLACSLPTATYDRAIPRWVSASLGASSTARKSQTNLSITAGQNEPAAWLPRSRRSSPHDADRCLSSPHDAAAGQRRTAKSSRKRRSTPRDAAFATRDAAFATRRHSSPSSPPQLRLRASERGGAELRQPTLLTPPTRRRRRGSRSRARSPLEGSRLI